MTLDSPVQEIKGVGEIQAQKLAVLGVNTVGQLINFYPKRYDDFSQITTTEKLKPGAVTLEAEIKQTKGRFVRRGMHITEAIASDATGSVRLVWFNQPYRAASLRPKHTYYISGQYELSHQHFTIINPNIELASEFPINTARILPIYRETKGLTSRQIRLILKQAMFLFDQLHETLPDWILSRYGLMGRVDALKAIHFPDSTDNLQAARFRLGFEEVFQLSLASLLNKKDNETNSALAIPFQEDIAKKFVKHLPFQLTDAQRKVIWQIYLDLQKNKPMNRLVEGDVGSGKTVVATMAAVMVMNQGFQVAFMAPTEILARQHAETILQLLRPLRMEARLGLLVGSMTNREKEQTRQELASGQLQFIVGTHALIQEKVDMLKLALVIVDEQHRFGVHQRKTLMAKAGHMPHVLSLTATPIPRSLALTVFGELDISRIDTKPPGRLPIITKLISPNSRQHMEENIRAQLANGKQMYVVCPIIKESDDLQINSVEKVFTQISEHEFKGWRTGLLHGKLKPKEKNKVMDNFIAHKLDILVSTTVIEVGVDVKDASVMLIESPERFGLAQIHQLRGRIGRANEQGYCYLLLSDSNPPSRRLRAIERSDDGFKLAELDLEIRGPGAIYGTSQHGLLDLRLTTFTDTKLISTARSAATEFLKRKENLLHYKELMTHVKRLRAVTNLN